MKSFFGVLFLVLSVLVTGAQTGDARISSGEVQRILTKLASDEMRGRRAFTPDIDRAADFIVSEFARAGLQPFPGLSGFRQEFSMTVPKGVSVAGSLNGQAITEMKMTNVVGYLPGKGLKEEIVIFSGHYDHLGVGKPVNGDSIYNGANDDAAGITGVIMLANYFKALNNNERSLVFVAFTAEEVGGFGSEYFSRQVDPARVMAMFNIEMIGTESKWGKNSAYITGYEKTNMGELLAKDLEGTGFTFYPDPYPQQQLFYRSDNATLARLGVPAHTISTSKMDVEPHYHKRSDHVETLDIVNMTEVIKAIALSSKNIVAGLVTPSRVKVEELH